MQILRHSKIAITMDIHTGVPSASSREALRKLEQRPDDAPVCRGGTLEHVISLQILHVPECPGAEALNDRLAPLVASFSGIRMTRQVVVTEEDAARLGMTGSPTILANGVDPFASPGLEPSLSCRLYRDENGRLGPAPSAGQLRQVLGPGTP